MTSFGFLRYYNHNLGKKQEGILLFIGTPEGARLYFCPCGDGQKLRLGWLYAAGQKTK
jgi:hypothetical protein